jgi:hypothetical protein
MSKVKMSPFGEIRRTKSKHREGRQSEQATNNEMASKERMLKEPTRLDIVKGLAGKSMHQAEAAQQLGISVRQVKRIWRAYQEGGAEELISRRRGKPSNNRLSQEVKQQAVDLLYSRYPDFGPTLAHEKLSE